MQLVFSLRPQSRLLQRPLHTVVHVSTRQVFIQTNAECNVLVNRHRERRWLLEDHAHARAQQVQVITFFQGIAAVENDFALSTLTWVQVIHAVERTQQR